MNVNSPEARWARAKFRKAKVLCLNAKNPPAQTETKTCDKFSFQSSAQVETYVAQNARHRSGELKLEGARRHNLSRALSCTFGVRFRANELALVKERARKIGCTTNAYIRASVLGSDYKPPRDPELVSVLRRTLAELSRQGNNLNQLAKAKNAGEATPSQIAVRLEAIRGPLVRALETVRSAVAYGLPHP